jgi:hypothetical protein
MKYNTTHPNKCPKILNLSRDTKELRYGDRNYNNTPKILATTEERYGKEGLMGGKDFIEKTEHFYMTNYGVRNYSQIGLTPSGYAWKEYTLPSGKVIKYQGYEGRYIKVLLRKYGEDNITFEKKDIPKIQYLGEGGKYHYYFPDFYIPCENLIIEIKSRWTYEADKEKNQIKFNATVTNGFKLKVKIYE